MNWPDASPWRLRQQREEYLLSRVSDEGDATSTV
jgi:hypothetical protein